MLWVSFDEANERGPLILMRNLSSAIGRISCQRYKPRQAASGAGDSFTDTGWRLQDRRCQWDRARLSGDDLVAVYLQRQIPADAIVVSNTRGVSLVQNAGAVVWSRMIQIEVLAKEMESDNVELLTGGQGV